MRTAGGGENTVNINASVDFDVTDLAGAGRGKMDADWEINSEAFFLYDSKATKDIDLSSHGWITNNSGGEFDYWAVHDIVNWNTSATVGKKYFLNTGIFKNAGDGVVGHNATINAPVVNAGEFDILALNGNAGKLYIKGTMTSGGQTFAFENSTGVSILSVRQGSGALDYGFLGLRDSAGNKAELWQHAGLLTTNGYGNIDYKGTATEATISCSTLYMDGGQVFSSGNDGFTNGLLVLGDWSMQGGIINVDLINWAGNWLWDNITLTGNWTWGAGQANSKAGTLNMTVSGTPVPNGTYDVIDVAGSFSGADFNTVTGGNNFTTWGVSGKQYVFTK